MIPYGRQDISDADIEAVTRVLRSDFLTQGPAVAVFEDALTKHCDAGYAVATNSATSALHIACLALGVGPGDLVWTSPITFVASANCALYCGAQVDFVDIDARTFNMCADALALKLESAAAIGRLPKVVIPVHMCGQSCDMRAIRALSDRYGFAVIEDASHAVGGRYLGEPIGNCAFSEITILSFHPVKIITTAEGGAALTNDGVLAERLRKLRSHGISRNRPDFQEQAEGDWYYEQQELGFNYRITDMQAALGSSQILNLEPWISRRHALAQKYDKSLCGLALKTPFRNEESYSAFHLYVILLQDEAPVSRKIVFQKLRSDGIGVNVHYIPVHLQPYYQRLGFSRGDYPIAEDYYSRCISIPMFSALTDAEQDFVVARIRAALE